MAKVLDHHESIKRRKRGNFDLALGGGYSAP